MKYISEIKYFEDLPEAQKKALAEVKITKSPADKFTLADYLAVSKTPLYPAISNKGAVDGFYYVELDGLKKALLQVGIGAVGNVMEGDKLVISAGEKPAMRVFGEVGFNIRFSAAGGKWRSPKNDIVSQQKVNTL